MRCYECGYQNNDEVKVCIKCGTKLEDGMQANPTPAPISQPKTDENNVGGAKTIRGVAASTPSWDAPTSPGNNKAESSSIIKCPSCHFYPLPSLPNEQSPCPNCGFGAGSGSSASKTVKVDAINLDGEPEKTSFKLVDENSGKEWGFEGQSTDINRDDIDSENNSISSEVHATFSFENGELNIEDKSSNGATFIKVDGKMPVKNGNKVVIGNKVFTIKID